MGTLIAVTTGKEHVTCAPRKLTQKAKRWVGTGGSRAHRQSSSLGGWRPSSAHKALQPVQLLNALLHDVDANLSSLGL